VCLRFCLLLRDLGSFENMDAIKERLMNLTDQDKQKLGLLSALVLTIVWLAIGIGSSLVCSVICFVYPAYKSFKAVESPQGDDDTQWLTYWIVYSTFNILEYFADIIFFWIPMYNLLKCLFLLWCMWPIPNNGATVVYKKILRPFLLKNEEKIDARLDKVTGKVNKYVDDAKREAADFADSSAGVMLSAGAQVATETASQQLDDALNEDADKDKEI